MFSPLFFRRVFPAILVLASAGPAAAQMPSIASISPEETVSSSYMEHPAIAADSKGQPHAVADFGVGNNFMKFHRVNNRWSGGIFATGQRGSRYDASRLYIGQIEVDARDRAWISCKFGVKEYGTQHGQGVWLFLNVARNPAPAEKFYRFVSVYKGMGLVSTDAKYPDQGVVLGTFGNWEKLDDSGNRLARGSLNAGLGGEKVRFRIASSKPRFGSQAGAADGVWHTAMNGFSAMSSAYQNSLRYAAKQGPVTWAAYGPYPQQGDDYCHPGLGVDLVNPKIAYIGSVFGRRLGINIWNGSQMLFPPTSLKILDHEAAFEGRHSIQFAPALTGGTFVFWSSGNRIKMAFLAQDGTVTMLPIVTAGRSPAACTDGSGNIHLLYANNGIKYRKIQLSILRAIRPQGRFTAHRRPRFKWTDTQTSLYTLELSRDGNVVDTIPVPTNTWQPPENLPVGAYQWRVREGGRNAVNQPWSESLAFVIPPAAPVPVSPHIRFPNAPFNPRLTWRCDDPAVNAYRIELFRGPVSLGKRVVPRDPEKEFSRWSAKLPAGEYAWRLRGLRQRPSHTVASAWSRTMEFQIAIPGPTHVLAPDDRQVFEPGWQSITCAWDQAEAADAYKFKILFNDTLLDRWTHLRQTEQVIAKAFEPGYYSFLVQPKNGYGAGPWTPIRTFIVSRQMWPGHDETLFYRPVQFEWTPSPNATRYQVHLDVYDPATARYLPVLTQWVRQPAFGTPVWKPNFTLTKNAYRWRVTDFTGNKRGYSSSAFFQVRLPGRPNLLSPHGNGYGPRNLPFVWEDPWRSAESFQLQVLQNGERIKNSGWRPVAVWTPLLDAFSQSLAFPNEGSGACTWRVRGRNSAGIGPWKAASFAALPLAAPILTDPADGGVVPADTPYAFAWQSVSNATCYEIQILQDETPITGDVVDGTTWSWSPPAGAYTVRVRAGQTGWSRWSSQSFSAGAP